MGRPIKNDYIGNVSINGSQIACYAWVPGDTQSRASYIDRQTGTGRYYVTSNDGAHEGEVILANIDGGNLAIGQASVVVTTFAEGSKYAEVIYDNTVRTFDGINYKWYFNDGTYTIQYGNEAYLASS